MTKGGGRCVRHTFGTIGGNTYRYSWQQCGSDALSVPECPSANGDVRASSGSKTLNITQEVWQGSTGAGC